MHIVNFWDQYFIFIFKVVVIDNVVVYDVVYIEIVYIMVVKVYSKVIVKVYDKC